MSDPFAEFTGSESVWLQTYQPHIWAVQKDDIYSSVYALDKAYKWLDYIHKTPNQSEIILKMVEDDMRYLKEILARLRSYDGSAEIYKNGH
jgi:uncharacterized protein involved in tellurium resistance